MRSFLSILYLAHAVLAGDLFTPQAYSPVGFGYSAAPVVPQQVAPLHYASPLRTSVGYGPLAAARFNQITPLAAPAPFLAPALAAPAPVAVPAAPYAPIVKQYAAVPAVADVPITRYEASPGFIQKYVDVAHPKVATTKIQIRRPAIQKQFYDIEERIVVRPVASAVVELDQPLSKTQAGPTLVSHAVPAYPPVAPVPISSPVPVPPLPPTPAFTPGPPPSNPPSFDSQNPFPSQVSSDSEDTSDDSDSITVDNEDFRARSRSQEMPQISQPQQPQQQSEPRPEERSQQEEQLPREQPQARISLPPTQQPELQTRARFLSRSQNPQYNELIPQARAFQIPDIIPSSRTSLTEDQSQANQQRLIDLLTSRGGVEVRSGVSVESSGDAGQIRGRVLSVTPAPQTSGPSDERVSTRRVVVNRPIQTLQEIDVVQPFTKVHRLSVQQPALLKTQRIDIARVKTLAPIPVTSYGAPYGYLH